MYRADAARLAIELGTLAITGGSKALDADGLDVALLGRTSVLSSCRSILTTVTGQRPGPESEYTRSVRHLMEAPVINLQRELGSYPTTEAQTPLSDRMTAPPTDETALAWYNAAKHAELTSHDLSDLLSRLEDGHRWTVVADVAAVARTVYVLDGHLLEAAERLQSPAAEALRQSATSALPYAAEETLVLARSGQLPDLDTIIEAPSATTPVQFNGPAAAVEAQSRLPRQLLDAEDLSPEAIGITALTQARILAFAAQRLSTDDPFRATLAADVSNELRLVRANDPQLASLAPSDHKAMWQSRELLRYVEAAAQVDPTTAAGRVVRGSLLAVVDRAPDVVSALVKATERQLATRRWAVSYAGDEPDAPMWGIWTEALEPPRMYTQLQRAQATLSPDRLHLASFPALPRYTHEPHPHEALADVQRTRPRPPTPGRRNVGLDR